MKKGEKANTKENNTNSEKTIKKTKRKQITQSTALHGQPNNVVPKCETDLNLTTGKK